MDPFHPFPFNFWKWIEVNQSKLVPPVGNALMYGKGCEYKVMIVGGPNTRTDFHVNQTEEWFFQLQGSMLLKVVDMEGKFRDIVIREGEQFLLPANTPHSPQRFSNTLGLVMEIERPSSCNDILRWYCPNESCRSIIYEASFHCVDLGTQLAVAINGYYSGPDSIRTCTSCGAVDSRPEPNSLPDPNVSPHNANGPDSSYSYDCEKNSLPYLRSTAPSFGLSKLVQNTTAMEAPLELKACEGDEFQGSGRGLELEKFSSYTNTSNSNSAHIPTTYVSLSKPTHATHQHVDGTQACKDVTFVRDVSAPLPCHPLLRTLCTRSVVDVSGGESVCFESPPSSPEFSVTMPAQPASPTPPTLPPARSYSLTSPAVKMTVLAGQKAISPGQWIVSILEAPSSSTSSSSSSSSSTSTSNASVSIGDGMDLSSSFGSLSSPDEDSAVSTTSTVRSRRDRDAVISKHERFLFQLNQESSIQLEDSSPFFLKTRDCVLIPRNVKHSIHIQEGGSVLCITTTEVKAEDLV